MNSHSMKADWAAIFDWDGVIVNSSDLHARSWDMLAAEGGRTLPPGHFERGFGRKNEQIIPEILGWAQAPAEVRAIAARKEVLYRRLVQETGLALLPGVADWLSALRQAGVPCVIGSSTERANIEVVLDLHGLRDSFDGIVCGDDVAEGKPHPGIFLKAAGKAGREPQRCVVFEDALVGIAAARAGGMKVVAVTTTNAAAALAGADRVIDRLDELHVEDVRGLLGA